MGSKPISKGRLVNAGLCKNQTIFDFEDWKIDRLFKIVIILNMLNNAFPLDLFEQKWNFD